MAWLNLLNRLVLRACSDDIPANAGGQRASNGRIGDEAAGDIDGIGVHSNRHQYGYYEYGLFTFHYIITFHLGHNSALDPNAISIPENKIYLIEMLSVI